MLVSFYRFLRTPEHTSNILIILVAYLMLMWLVYLPFVFKIDKYYSLDFQDRDNTTFLRFLDGPYYAGIAKSFYRPNNVYFDNVGEEGVIYYTNHLPLYPILIKLFAVTMPFEMAMLMVSQLAGVMAVVLVYYFLNTTDLRPKESLVLSMVTLVLPARALLLHNVGASEPLFLCLVVLMALALRFDRFYWTCFLVSLAVITRASGLFLVLGLWLIWFLFCRKDFKKLVMTMLPLFTYALLVAYWYLVIPGFNFFGRTGGFEFILRVPPLNMFFLNPLTSEGVGFIMLGMVAGVMTLCHKTAVVWEKKLGILLACGVSFVVLSFHPDNMRYIYPFVALLVIYPLRRLILDKRFLVGLLFLLPGFIMSTWAFLTVNQTTLDQFATWISALRS